MPQTSYIRKAELGKLPDIALSLISMGQYTLYKVQIPKKPEVTYALRAGAYDVYLLTSEGDIVQFDDLDGLEVKEKIIIEDVDPPFVVQNFGLNFATSRT